MKYAAMLAKKMDQHRSTAWFVNTGWTGGSYGVGKRVSLRHTRAIVDAIHNGELEHADYVRTSTFRFLVPKYVTGVPDAVLQPRSTWADCDAYDAQLQHLAKLFTNNMKLFESSSHTNRQLVDEIMLGGPQAAELDKPSEEATAGIAPGLPRAASCAFANGVIVNPIKVEGKLMT